MLLLDRLRGHGELLSALLRYKCQNHKKKLIRNTYSVLDDVADGAACCCEAAMLWHMKLSLLYLCLACMQAR